MAKKKKTRKRAARTLSLGIALPMVYFGSNVYKQVQRDGLSTGLGEGMGYLTGYSPKAGAFIPGQLDFGAKPILYGSIVHWIATKLGVNRVLAKAGIPYVRI